LSGRGLCDELITRPEESYRLCCVVVCDLETSRMGTPYIYDISHLRVNQPDTTVLQVYYLTFMYRSTCFGRLHAHFQELTTALTASGFTPESGGSSVVVRGLAG